MNTLSASSSLTNLSSSSQQQAMTSAAPFYPPHNSSTTSVTSTISSASLTLPKIEFKPVDFGPIAEGSLSQLLVYLNVTNADAIIGSIDSSAVTLSLDIELPSFNHWCIEPVDVTDGGAGTTKPRKSSLLLKKVNKVNKIFFWEVFFYNNGVYFF